jgi:hypothetical protein
VVIWLCLGAGWLVVSVVVALGVGRWFKFMRDADRDW